MEGLAKYDVMNTYYGRQRSRSEMADGMIMKNNFKQYYCWLDPVQTFTCNYVIFDHWNL